MLKWKSVQLLCVTKLKYQQHSNIDNWKSSWICDWILPPGCLGSRLEIVPLCSTAPSLHPQNPYCSNLKKLLISLPWLGLDCSVHWQGDGAVQWASWAKLLHLRIIIVTPGRDSRCVTEQRNFLGKDWSTKENIKAKVQLIARSEKESDPCLIYRSIPFSLNRT